MNQDRTEHKLTAYKEVTGFNKKRSILAIPVNVIPHKPDPCRRSLQQTPDSGIREHIQ